MSAKNNKGTKKPNTTNKNNKGKKQASPFMEWLSDYLRYFELAIILILLIGAAVFGVRAIMNRSTRNQPSASAMSNAMENQPTEAATPTPTATPTATATPTPTPKPTEEPVPLKTDNEIVTQVVSEYFDTLLASGENPDIESYSDIVIYSVPGDVQNSYVAFAEYQYKYTDYEAQVPALTELYVTVDSEAQTATVVGEPDEAQNAFMDKAAESAEAAALIAKVTAEYQAVMEANPELEAYINS